MTRRRLLIGAACAALLAIVAIFALLPQGADTLSCRRVALTDSISRGLIQGAEDLALDPTAPRLIVSAYDRRSDAPGGLYAVSLDALLDPNARLLTAQRLAAGPGTPAIRPHGIGFGPPQGDSVPLVVIERKRRLDHTKDAVLQAYALGPGGLAPAGGPISDPLLCNANDVVGLPEGGALVTTDREACDGLGRRLEDVLGLKRGRLLSVGRDGVAVLASGIGFANGIALDEGYVYVAATRAHALLIFERARLGQAPPRRLELGAAPDNLAWGDDGALYIAAHLSLPRFALFRLGLAGASKSAVYRYDPAGGAAARPVLLGRAGGGGAVSGATVAVMARGRLILGAGFDAGLSVCTKGGAR
jgi:hypothetical protein